MALEHNELDNLLEFYSGIWGKPGREEWLEWSQRLKLMQFRFCREAFSNLWASQNKRHKPLWSEFIAAYRLVVAGWNRALERPTEGGVVNGAGSTISGMSWREFVQAVDAGTETFESEKTKRFFNACIQARSDPMSMVGGAGLG